MYKRYQFDSFPKDAIKQLAREQMSKDDAEKRLERSGSPYRRSLKFNESLRDEKGSPTKMAVTQLREEEFQQYFHDPRLLHLNLEYNRLKRLNEIRPEINDKALEEAYEAILKSNERADEFNYRIDFYRSL